MCTFKSFSNNVVKSHEVYIHIATSDTKIAKFSNLKQHVDVDGFKKKSNYIPYIECNVTLYFYLIGDPRIHTCIYCKI